MRKNRKYSKAECLSYLEECMCSSQNRSEFEREKGLKRTTISRWLRIFGIEDKPSPIMSKKLSQMEQELHDRIQTLSRILCKWKQDSVVSLVTILFSALTRMFPKPTFAP